MKPSHILWSAFLGSFLVGLIGVLLPAKLDQADRARRMESSVGDMRLFVSDNDRPALRDTHGLTSTVWVTSQIAPDDVAAFKDHGFRTVIDLRPDGEEPDQPASEAIGAAVRAAGLEFVYIPVPHGAIPDAAADALAAALTKALAQGDGRVLLHCRSGRRAARTWALAEAARPDGLAVYYILKRATAVGQPADDLAARLNARVAARARSVLTPPPVPKDSGRGRQE